MGAIEEGGKVATSVVDSLKSQPLTLALVLFNVVFLIVVYMGTAQQRGVTEKLITMMLDNQAKTAELLFKCSPDRPQQQRGSIPLPYKQIDLIK